MDLNSTGLNNNIFKQQVIIFEIKMTKNMSRIISKNNIYLYSFSEPSRIYLKYGITSKSRDAKKIYHEEHLSIYTYLLDFMTHICRSTNSEDFECETPDVEPHVEKLHVETDKFLVEEFFTEINVNGNNAFEPENLLFEQICEIICIHFKGKRITKIKEPRRVRNKLHRSKYWFEFKNIDSQRGAIKYINILKHIIWHYQNPDNYQPMMDDLKDEGCPIPSVVQYILSLILRDGYPIFAILSTYSQISEVTFKY